MLTKPLAGAETAECSIVKFCMSAIGCDGFEYASLNDVAVVPLSLDHRISFMMVAAVAALMLFANLQVSIAYAAPPVAKIVSVDYPHHVLATRVFPVTIIAEFSEKVGVDIGIWDVENGVVVQSISIPLRELEPISLTFNLTAPAGMAEWRLLAITRIWWLNAWYQDPLEGSKSFTVSISNTATVTLASSVTPSSLTFDGVTYDFSNANQDNLSVTLGFHRIDALSVIQGKVGERYVFVGWSDGITSNPRLVTIVHDLNLTAIYRTEYYLSVNSEHRRTIGGGWYPADSSANFALVPNSPVSLGLPVENYEFVGWSGNSNSSDVLASVLMDGPKSVEARWMPSGITITQPFFSAALLLGSLVLFARGTYRIVRRRPSRILSRRVHHWAKLLLVAMILVTVMIQVPFTYAELPIQSGRSVVRIGDATWYYWNNTSSDTCLIWLGGGTTQEQEIGHYSYLINPLEYESFGTIRFIQDLSRYYCFIALQKGSSEYYSVDSNRAIYQEPYQMDSRILGDIHEWIKSQGYAHTVLVGYSTGAQVAAMEATLRAPSDWSSPDGLVLITPRLSEVVSKAAYRMRASLLILYGGSIETPAYVSTGHDFFLNAPANGWYESSYFFKEFQVIEKMGHEVWTVYDTGVYDTQTERNIISFVNKVKALQFTAQDITMVEHAAENPPAPINNGVELISADAPSEAPTGALVGIRVSITYSNQATTTAQVVGFNMQSRSIEIAQEFVLGGSRQRVILFNYLPPSNSTDLSLAIIMLIKANDGWHVASNPIFTRTKLLSTLRVTIASSLTGIPVVFDGTQFIIPETGTLSLDTKPGLHITQVEPVTYITPQMRALFAGWDDGSTDTTRRISLNNDTSVYLDYRLQYFLNVTSPYGRTTGSGWYDSNSTAVAFVQPPILGKEKAVFTQWKGDVNSSGIRIPLNMDSPKTAQAEWDILPLIGPTTMNTAIFLFSLTLFALAVLWNIKPLIRSHGRIDAG